MATKLKSEALLRQLAETIVERNKLNTPYIQFYMNSYRIQNLTNKQLEGLIFMFEERILGDL
jgi:hypothetical protein